MGFKTFSEELRMSNQDILNIQSLTVTYGSHTAIKDVNLSIRKGEILALIGPNGAGKTTLIRAVSGVIHPQAGEICLSGKNLADFSPARRAKYLSVVPQARNLPEAFTVRQTVLLGRTPYLGWLGQPSSSDHEHVTWALERTETLSLADRRIGELSGGEQQRVLLARALAQQTPIMLLDEPTAHLDLHHQARLLNLVRELTREQGLAVLMALHDLNLVAIYADRVALLVNGQLSFLGTPNEVLTPSRLSEAYQLQLNVVPHPEYGTPLILPDGLRP